MRIDRDSQSRYSNLTFQVGTPEGMMFVSILENDKGEPCGIDIKIGKAGAPLQAWAHSFGRILTLALEHGADIEEFMDELCMQTSDRLRTYNGTRVRSGPEGVYAAIRKYKNHRYSELKREFPQLDSPPRLHVPA